MMVIFLQHSPYFIAVCYLKNIWHPSSLEFWVPRLWYILYKNQKGFLDHYYSHQVNEDITKLYRYTKQKLRRIKIITKLATRPVFAEIHDGKYNTLYSCNFVSVCEKKWIFPVFVTFIIDVRLLLVLVWQYIAFSIPR